MFLSPGSLLNTASVIINIGDSNDSKSKLGKVINLPFSVKCRCEKDPWVDRIKRQHSIATVVPLQS